jgi:hypothetical protein
MGLTCIEALVRRARKATRRIWPGIKKMPGW